jgi:hypothetical protein
MPMSRASCLVAEKCIVWTFKKSPLSFLPYDSDRFHPHVLFSHPEDRDNKVLRNANYRYTKLEDSLLIIICL